MKTFFLTTLALIAFAANSVLCRMALGEGAIDAAGFTTIRLLSGAAALWLLLRFFLAGGLPRSSGSWQAATMLFVYALAFSFAYLALNAGTGALILFGSVQITMFSAGLLRGERLGTWAWIGFALAAGGLIFLVLPGVSAPEPAGSLLMAAAGAAWGLYCLPGRAGRNPLEHTTANFARATPMAIAASILLAGRSHFSSSGIVLAIISGAVTSGCGYVIWYSALRHLTILRASIVQLCVPVLAALGGVAFLGESMTWRLTVSGALILGGVGLAAGRQKL